MSTNNDYYMHLKIFQNILAGQFMKLQRTSELDRSELHVRIQIKCVV